MSRLWAKLIVAPSTNSPMTMSARVSTLDTLLLLTTRSTPIRPNTGTESFTALVRRVRTAAMVRCSRYGRASLSNRETEDQRSLTSLSCSGFEGIYRCRMRSSVLRELGNSQRDRSHLHEGRLVEYAMG